MKFDIGERLLGWFEVAFCACRFGLANNGQWGLRHTVDIVLLMNLATSANGQLQFLIQGVNHRDAYTMQPSGYLVAVVVKLAACVQYRHDYFGSGNTFGVHICWDATPVIRNSDCFTGMDGHTNIIAMTCKRLVDRVIHELENHVVKTRAIVGVTNVHSWS